MNLPDRILRYIQDQPVAVRGIVGSLLAFLVAAGIIDVGLSAELEALAGSVIAFLTFLTARQKVEPLALQERRLAAAVEIDDEPGQQ